MGSPPGQARILLSRDELVRVKMRAFRKRVWFRVLTRTERAIVDLTIRVVERVRSPLLAKMLISIVKKLFDAMESEVAHLMKTLGRHLAQKFSKWAVRWGNREASSWAEETGFVQYLTIMDMNTPSMFKV